MVSFHIVGRVEPVTLVTRLIYVVEIWGGHAMEPSTLFDHWTSAVRAVWWCSLVAGWSAFNTDQQGIVHDIELRKHHAISCQLVFDHSGVSLTQVDFLLPVLIIEKVQILKSCSGFGVGCVDVPSNPRSFQIVNSINMLFFPKLKCVAHQDQIYRIVILHGHPIHTVNPSQHRVRIMLQMQVNIRQDILD